MKFCIKSINYLSILLISLFNFLGLHIAMAGMQNKDMLSELLKKCQESAEKFDYPNELKYSEMLLATAQKENNQNYILNALFFRGASKLFTGKSQEAASDLVECLKLSKQLGNDSMTALTYNVLAIYEGEANNNLYISQNYLLRAKEYADKVNLRYLTNSVINNLSEVAKKQDDPSGIEYAMRQYQQGKDDKDEHMMYLGADNLAYFNYLSGDIENAKKYLNIARHIKNKNGYIYDGTLNYTEILVEAESGNLENAESIANTYLKYCMENAPEKINEAIFLLATVKHMQGQYTNSIELLSKFYPSESLGDNIVFEEKIERLRYKNYNSAGQLGKALSSLAKADSLYMVMTTSEKDHLSNERKLMLDILDHEKQAQIFKLESRQQKFLIYGLAICAILLVIICTGLIAYIRKRNSLYRRMVANQKEIINLKEEIGYKSETISPMIDEPSDNNNSTVTNENKSGIDAKKSESLYKEMCRLMTEERLYADPKFTREDFIERLHTNRTYFSSVINEHTGKNYPQWVNSYRIQEAIKILSDASMADYPIKQLGFELGFISPGTFSKLFQQAVGMTPSNFRKFSLQESRENL